MKSSKHCALALAAACCLTLRAQQPAQPTQPATAGTQATAPAAQGGTIRGRIAIGATAKGGGVPLPGVAVTATNTLTGRKYTTATDVDGQYAMRIPRNGRYVVRAELAGFAVETKEVVLNGVATEAAAQGIQIVAQPTDFDLQLASRAEAAAAAQTTQAASLARGLQSLSLGGTLDADAASEGTGNQGVQMPSLGSTNDSITGAAASTASDTIAVNGQQGQTSGLANFSEDEIRQRIEDAVAQGRASGMIPPGTDTSNIVVNVLGALGGGGGFDGGGGRGGGRGGRGGGGGFGAFRNFNPAQPHGSVFYQGSNNALNASQWLVGASGEPHFTANPAGYSNRFGVSLAGSPYIPGLTKPNTKQFAFLNLTGQKNLNAFEQSGRVPTALERAGNFTQSEQVVNGTAQPVALYNPATGLPFGCAAGQTNCATNIIPPTMIAQQALNLLNYYPAPNFHAANAVTDPTANNYQTVANAGNNTISLNARFVRNFGATPQGGFGGFRRGAQNGAQNGPASLRQNLNIGFNYSHAAADNRNIFLLLGGATASNNYSLNAGYVIGYGRLSNNASINWNRSQSTARNYFTDTDTNPAAAAGLCVPNGGTASCGAATGGFADARFFNGLPALNISNFTGLSNQTPSETINQTISFSDFVAWRHARHNLRLGLDVRRVHADSIGGNNPLGRFTFTGYATASPSDQAAGTAGQTSGAAFADFLLGLPQSTAIQAGLYKDYLRENVLDWFVNDDYRIAANLTLNYGLRFEYFGPYTEKNGRLVNLTNVTSTTGIGCVSPIAVTDGGVQCSVSSNPSLVNADHTMYAPRFGFAYRPKFAPKLTRDTVVRGGYGINYNTGQYATFAKLLAHQQPFAVTETNTLSSGCTTTTTGSAANMTLANGFGCSTLETLQNNWAVDPHYKLGMVQVYNLNLQRTFGPGLVFNIGYNGSHGSGLDVVGSPNATPTGTTTPGVSPFDYEESAASSRSNQLVVSLQKRQQKGIAIGATYVYSHSIDDASGVGGAVGTPIQNFYALQLEEGNSSFDQRHNLTGNWLFELPFGPNRAFFNQGGLASKLLDGFSLSGTFTFATGTYYTPQYAGSSVEALSGNTFTYRPDRVVGQSLRGPGTLTKFFNTAAFTAPTTGTYGTASQGSIEGPGTVSTAASLSRTVQLGGTRSFEARVTANNVFNTVQYSGINTTENSATFGQVTGAASMRSLQMQARYRF